MRFGDKKYPNLGAAQIHPDDASQWVMEDEGDEDEESSEAGPMDDTYFDDVNQGNNHSYPYRMIRY